MRRVLVHLLVLAYVLFGTGTLEWVHVQTHIQSHSALGGSNTYRTSACGTLVCSHDPSPGEGSADDPHDCPICALLATSAGGVPTTVVPFVVVLDDVATTQSAGPRRTLVVSAPADVAARPPPIA